MNFQANAVALLMQDVLGQSPEHGRTPVEHDDDRLLLQVKLLADACGWYWEIGAGPDTRVVASSWADEWVAFASRGEAAAAGARRLVELRSTRSAA